MIKAFERSALPILTQWRVAFCLFCGLLVLPFLIRAPATRHDLRQQAYIWQRVWTPALNDAVVQSAALVDGWRLLFGEIDRDDQAHLTRIDWSNLRRSHHPLIMVIRIDGALTQVRAARVLQRVSIWIRDMRSHTGMLAGLEIDYDCGTERLADYAVILASLRSELDPALRLSITTLPDWMRSPKLMDVLNASDETVLQLHAVQSPRSGLFAAPAALRWVQAYARISNKPFWVSLPIYGARVAWGTNGRIEAIESETPTLVQAPDNAELITKPDDIDAFLRNIRTATPALLRGVLWFRLPTADDKRAWSLTTWRAIVLNLKRHPDVEVRKIAAPGRPGVEDISLINVGDSDAEMPLNIPLSDECAAADGINGYAVQRRGAIVFLTRTDERLIHPGVERNVGWARCSLP